MNPCNGVDLSLSHPTVKDFIGKNGAVLCYRIYSIFFFSSTTRKNAQQHSLEME